MESTVTDPKAQENIKETLHNTAQISARINKLMGGKAQSVELFVKNIKEVSQF